MVVIGGRKAGKTSKAEAWRRAYLDSIKQVCNQPISRCVDAGQHVPVCRCALDAGHTGQHMVTL